eukprot:3317314-Rhodomonas_salina.1
MAHLRVLTRQPAINKGTGRTTATQSCWQLTLAAEGRTLRTFNLLKHRQPASLGVHDIASTDLNCRRCFESDHARKPHCSLALTTGAHQYAALLQAVELLARSDAVGCRHGSHRLLRPVCSERQCALLTQASSTRSTLSGFAELA